MRSAVDPKRFSCHGKLLPRPKRAPFFGQASRHSTRPDALNRVGNEGWSLANCSNHRAEQFFASSSPFQLVIVLAATVASGCAIGLLAPALLPGSPLAGLLLLAGLSHARLPLVGT
ncbi:hypothetical protein MicloDRAFT_00001040 [Microvirga lotononidis]|uniref:Uncharacterized protein n=1 Tax=Microvirga lotononidis TaxID=864069 RepID=I4Z4H4_9HYPH|nr:hypothetical protein MicloDRAFT_00001040 [Microvirga lotononidis]